MSRPPSPTDAVGDVWGDEQPGRGGRLLDLAVGVGFAVLIGILQRLLLPWSALAAVLLGGALAVRRIWWPGMALLAIAAAAVQLISGEVAVVADAVYAVLFFGLGAHRERRVRRFGLAAGVLAVIVAGAWAGLHRLRDDVSGQDVLVAGVGMTALAAVVILGGWVTGYLRWQRRQSVQARVDAGLAAVERRRLGELYQQEQERSRIAADMHDLVAHSWAVVAAQADGARYVVDSDPARASEALGVIGETARSAMTDVRALLAQLRDQDAARDTLEFEQPEALVERMRLSGMDLRLRRHGTPAASPLVQSATRRVLAEALTNALKHGDLSAPVGVEEDWRHGYRLRVTNAVAAAPPGPGTSRGHGLLGMRERMSMVGGLLTAAREGNDWVVEARIPEEDR